MRLPPFRGAAMPAGLLRVNPDSPQASGLIVAWPLNGVVLPATGQRPTVLASQATWTTSPNGFLWAASNSWGLDFPYVMNIASPFTMTTWHYRTNSASSAHLLAIGTGTAGHVLEFASAEFRWVKASSGGTVASAATGWADNTVRHIALVYDGTNAIWYYNGAPFSSGAPSSPNTGTSTKVKLFTNGHDGYPEHPSSGIAWLRDARIYNRALSATEVAHLYAPETRWDVYAQV